MLLLQALCGMIESRVRILGRTVFGAIDRIYTMVFVVINICQNNFGGHRLLYCWHCFFCRLASSCGNICQTFVFFGIAAIRHSHHKPLMVYFSGSYQ